MTPTDVSPGAFTITLRMVESRYPFDALKNTE